MTELTHWTERVLQFLASETEATAKAMTRPTLYDVKVWIELATKIGPSAATGNWHAVEHNWEWDIPAK